MITMKRIQAACICQTLHFQLKEDVEPALAKRQVEEELARYKRSLDDTHTKYHIYEETKLDDGSYIVRIRKQYSQSPVGDYLD